MRLTLIRIIILLTIVSSCKKNKETAGCFPDAATVRIIENKQAVIKLSGTVDPVWIIEEGSIDTKLIPCDFPMEFYQDGLRVMISGEVKSTPQNGTTPCCTERFVLTKISK
jgi:hypothetical protein